MMTYSPNGGHLAPDGSGAAVALLSKQFLSVLHAMMAMAVNSTMFLFDLHEEWVIRVVMLGKIF